MSRETRSDDRPATFREVLASGEFRAIYAASALSWTGDYIAKAAVTALVYRQTGSVAASAATFAISFLPWLLGGPVLAALAERYPYRSVMITCDLARAGLIALVALPHLPVAAIILLLFLAALLNPPFDASRAAVTPLVLAGDRYVVGLTLQNSTNQAVQLVGYLTGSAVAAYHPHLALLIDSATFAGSAALIAFGVRARAAALKREDRRHLLREAGQGFRVVFGTPALRAIAIIVLSGVLFTAPPEGLAAAWAGALTHNDARQQATDQALIMMSMPFGSFLGGLLIGRLVPPSLRQRLIRPFAVLVPLALVPALLRPSAIVVAVLAAIAGAGMGGMLPASNGLFAQALPRKFRVRAFGIMQSGLQLLQGAAVMATGLLAAHFQVWTVVGLWSLAGVGIMLAASFAWPRGEFTSAIQAARAANLAAEAAEVTRAQAAGEAAAGEAVTGGVVPGQPVPGGAVPGGAVPGGAVPGGAVPGGAVPGGVEPGDDATPGNGPRLRTARSV